MIYDVIFWDFDGTLAHSKALWTNAVLRALRRFQPEAAATFDQVRPLMRNGYPWDVPDPDYKPLTGRDWWDFMERRFRQVYRAVDLPEDVARQAAPAVREEILRIENYHLFDDSIAVLEQCRRKGCRNILLSNNYPELEDVMAQLGLLPYFESLVVSGVLGWDKPRPQIYAHALELAGPGARCLMVGDNPVADVEGAKACGIPAALVHRPADCPADYYADTLAELMEQIL